MRRLVAIVIGLSVLACGGVSAAPVPSPPPPVVEAPPAEASEPLFPPLPERGEDRPADCILDLDGLKPVMRLRQPNARGAARMERKKGAVVERVALDDGTVVRLSRYGCAHYGETWELAPIPPDADAREAAVKHLGSLVTGDGVPPSIVGMLQRAPGIEPDGGFTCGDAVCAITRDDKVVTVVYDFPM